MEALSSTRGSNGSRSQGRRPAARECRATPQVPLLSGVEVVNAVPVAPVPMVCAKAPSLRCDAPGADAPRVPHAQSENNANPGTDPHRTPKNLYRKKWGYKPEC